MFSGLVKPKSILHFKISQLYCLTSIQRIMNDVKMIQKQLAQFNIMEET